MNIHLLSNMAEGLSTPCKKPKLDIPHSEDDCIVSHVTEVVQEKDDLALCDADVGITEFISNHQGFQGILKQRFSDFLVSEIAEDGERVTLTDISPPACDHEKPLTAEGETPGSDVFSQQQRDSLLLLSGGKSPDKQIDIQVTESKDIRSQLHQGIRKDFPLLDSRTDSREHGQKVVVAFLRSSTSDSHKSKHRDVWPHSGRNYCKFVLYKENKDTMAAINVLAKYLRIKPGMITYAGNKDKRGKTCQHLTLYRMSASRLHMLNKKLHGMALGDFRYCSRPLALGDLKGNHFIVVLRSVTGSSEQINQALTSVCDIGFINYFGMQRFGTSSVGTHLVGRALLKSDWTEAVELILKPRPGGSDSLNAARDSWRMNRDPEEALEVLGRFQCPERFLLTGIKQRNPSDLVGALGFIPRNTRLMYVHAYQSLLWNKLVSYRLCKHGFKPIIGDLVLSEDLADDAHSGTAVSGRKVFTEPTPLTVDNLHKYTIHDVVLPLPGYDITLPENDVGEQYTYLLAHDGLTKSQLQHKVKDYSLRGTYRRLLVKPAAVSWEIIRYDDPLEPLVQGDFEKIKEEILHIPTGGSQIALKMEFTLPSSTYATMLIREVLKTDTSSSYHSKLTADNLPHTDKTQKDTSDKLTADNLPHTERHI